MASCVSSCCALITRFKGSRVLLHLYDRGEENEAPPCLYSFTPDPRCEWYLPSPSLSQLQLSFLLKRDWISLNLSAAARLRAQHSLGVIFFGDCNLLHHCWQQALFYLHLQLHKVGFFPQLFLLLQQTKHWPAYKHMQTSSTGNLLYWALVLVSTKS